MIRLEVVFLALAVVPALAKPMDAPGARRPPLRAILDPSTPTRCLDLASKPACPKGQRTYTAQS